MKGKRTLSLLLSLLMAFSLFAGIAPQAQANDLIGDLLDRYFFEKDYLDSLFNESNLVKQGTCGKDAGANVWYQIYEISAADLSDTAFFKTLAEYSADGYLQLDPAEDYYGVKIFGNGEMENYKRNGYSAPWCDKIQLDRGEHVGETVDMDKKLILGYIAGPGDFKVLNNGQFTTASYKTGVTNVGQFAFFGQDMLTAVYLGESVKRIEDRAFESTEMLAAINMPSALEYLGKRAFYGCDKLTYWRAGACSKLTKIGERAFYGNSLLASVQFPQSLQIIDKMAFAWCRILGDENFVLPSSLTTIGDGAFMFDTHMGRINEINIPKNVLTIGSYAFLCCFGIGKGENDGLSFTSGGTSPLSIGNFAFAGCRELKHLRLDNRVVQIHTGAFAACERLENVVFGTDQNAKRVAIDSNAFTSAQGTAVSALELVSGFMSETGDEASEFIPTLDYDSEELASFTDLTAMTPLRDAAFQNRPASTIKVASDVSHSFPTDCVVHYPTADYNPSANSEWQGALDSGKTTWKGYRTAGDWIGHFHIYENTVVAPTHTAPGYTRHTCTICKAYYDDTPVPAGHTLTELRRFPATCTEDGLIVYECTGAGCTLPGDAEHAHIYTEVIPATGHDYSKCTTKAATCTEPGHRRGTCAACGEQIDETIPAKGHNPIGMQVVKAATCTEPGLSSGRCIDCGKLETAVISALGHNWGEWQITKPATATTDGEMQRVCKNDPSHKQTQVIPATGETGCDGGANCPSKQYRDVDQTKWYHEAVDYAIVNNLFNGTSDTTFAPNGTMTRGMLVTVLHRMAGEPAASAPASFTDLRQGWYRDAVAWAAENKIVEGISATQFAPDAKVTREQAMTMLMRYAAFKGCDVSARDNLAAFSDALSVSSWARDAMQWAVAAGLIEGVTDTTIQPRGESTRAQIATILMRFQTTLA